MAKKYKKCSDCDGSGHIFRPVVGQPFVFVEHCLTCRGTARVEVKEESDDERRLGMGKAFHTGDNTDG